MKKLPTGTNYCLCPTCGEYFNSVLPFEMHRAGNPEDRYCLTPDQMREKGMDVNKRGYWVSALREPRAAAST